MSASKDCEHGRPPAVARHPPGVEAQSLYAIALALAVTPLTGLAQAAETQRAVAQPAAGAIELTSYDAGYASEAAARCAGLTLLPPIADDTKTDAQFKRGQEMFSRYVELQKLEGACKAALNLYNDKTGKAAKVLHEK